MKPVVLPGVPGESVKAVPVYQHHGGSWRYDFRIHGHRYTKSGFPSREAAEAAGIEVRRSMRLVRGGWLELRRKESAANCPAPRDANSAAVLIVARCLQTSSTASPAGAVGFVYLVNAENGLTKIGYARDARARLATLQIGSPCKLWLIACIETNDMVGLERDLHDSYREYWSHGEWFRLPEVAIRRLCAVALVVYNHKGKARWYSSLEVERIGDPQIEGLPAITAPRLEAVQ